MWIANNWNDYKVIDCSQGEKLESWGGYLLIRPDPQVIWNTPKTHKGWKRPNAHYHRSERGGGQWQFFDLPEQFSAPAFVLRSVCPQTGENMRFFAA